MEIGKRWGWREEETEEVWGDIKQKIPHVGPFSVLLAFVFLVVGIPKWSSGGTTFIQPKSWLSIRHRSHYHNLGWHVDKQFSPFLTVCHGESFCPDRLLRLPHQAWHLPVAICTFPTVCTVESCPVC